MEVFQVMEHWVHFLRDHMSYELDHLQLSGRATNFLLNKQGRAIKRVLIEHLWGTVLRG